MNNVSQETQTAVEQVRPQQAYIAPLVDIESNESGYALYAEMPGVNREGIQVSVEDGNLIISGHRPAFQVPGEAIHREIRPADFRRVYELDPSIDTAKISARIEQGVLTVNLPKAESLKPRRIELE